MSENNNKNKGFVAVYRSLLEHWVWQDKVFSRGQAWISLLLEANHEERKTLIDGNLVTVKKGEKITSIRKLSEQWGWSTNKVSKFLDNLEEDNMIIQKRDTKKTVITIVNYDVYQELRSKKETQKNYRRDTEEFQKKNRRISEENKQPLEPFKPLEPLNHVYGEFENVFLTDEEIKKLQTRLPNSYKDLIERLSAYIAQSGKKYKSHYATILNWSRRDKETKETKKEKSNSSRYENDEDYLNELLGVSNE